MVVRGMEGREMLRVLGRGTTVSKQNRQRAAAVSPPCSSRSRSLSFSLEPRDSRFFLLCLFFLAADDGADHRHFNEASRTTAPSLVFFNLGE